MGYFHWCPGSEFVRQTKLPNTQTASERFSVLGAREKAVAREFYDLGQSDAVKRWYWSTGDSVVRFRPRPVLDWALHQGVRSRFHETREVEWLSCFYRSASRFQPKFC